ncbi:MAG: hypothetical protein ACPGTP_09655 [Bacteroidia bacterium]
MVFILSFIWTYIYLIFQGIKRRSFGYFNNRLKAYCYGIAFGLDQAANPLVKYSFTHWFVKPEGEAFGDPDKTLSHIFGVNKGANKGANKSINHLYPAGRMLANGINKVFAFFGEKNHVENAAKTPQ